MVNLSSSGLEGFSISASIHAFVKQDLMFPIRIKFYLLSYLYHYHCIAIQITNPCSDTALCKVKYKSSHSEKIQILSKQSLCVWFPIDPSLYANGGKEPLSRLDP